MCCWNGIVERARQRVNVLGSTFSLSCLVLRSDWHPFNQTHKHQRQLPLCLAWFPPHCLLLISGIHISAYFSNPYCSSIDHGHKQQHKASQAEGQPSICFTPARLQWDGGVAASPTCDKATPDVITGSPSTVAAATPTNAASLCRRNICCRFFSR